MKRNFFGDPIPANLLEIEEALMELDIVIDEASAVLDFEAAGGDFHGWSAMIQDIFGDKSISTMGYESKEQLIADLKFVGIDNITT
jgi:iron uptake system EfeUOB component EfeO/EfeM